jgi:ABC-2 type transport system permease protein
MNPFMRQGPLPKGDIRPLWDLLGVDFSEDRIIWQEYNPYPKLGDLEDEFVFIDDGAGAKEPFNEGSTISSGLQHLLFPFPGSVTGRSVSDMEFTPLVRTGSQSGTVRYTDMTAGMFGLFGGLNPNRRHIPGNVEYVLAGRIQGKAPDAPDNPGGEDEAGKKEGEIDVVLVADIDMLHEMFFRFREMGETPEAQVNFDFDNVTFVLNVLDELAGEKRFLELRKRRRQHRTLSAIDRATAKAREEAAKTRSELRKEVEEARDKEEKKLNDQIEKLRERLEKGEQMDAMAIAQRIQMALETGQAKLDRTVSELEQNNEDKIEEIERDLALRKDRVRDTYKLMAVVVPPIPPLLVAVVVFFIRRAREREGVEKSRLRG